MFKFHIQKYVGLLSIVLAAAAGCKAPALTTATENRSTPASWGNNTGDTTNTSTLPWRSFFTDPNLVTLTDTAGGSKHRCNAINAEFNNATARQFQAMYNYERTIVNAYLEVSTQMSNISNLEKSYELKSKQVDALTNSISISNDLFKNARADYLEVLMT